MRRVDLIGYIEQAGREASLPRTDLDRVVEAVSGPSVTRVARGDWHQDDALCPACLAGLAGSSGPPNSMMPMLAERVHRFAVRFDALTRGRAPVIEIED